jgi:hypothetical protein
MTAILQAYALYEGRDRTFHEDLAAFIHTGRVYITPTCVLFAKAVPSSVKQHGPWDLWEEAQCDCWLIWLAAGDLGEFFRYAPFPLPWICWARRWGPLKWHAWERVRHLVEVETRGKTLAH